MTTTLYLVRHGATEANLVQPYRLQGSRSNGMLAEEGVHQAERTRDRLAEVHIDCIYSSPMQRAVQTAKIIAAPHGLPARFIDELTECDVGDWEGLTWETIREQYRTNCQLFLENPALHGYPGGENFTQVADRIFPAFDSLFQLHAGETILVASHHVVCRIYLAALIALPPAHAREVKLDNCGVSVIVRDTGQTRLLMLNSTTHLRGDRAAA